MVRLHPQALADHSGNHGKSSQCTGGRPGCARTRMPGDPPALCVPSALKPSNCPAGACFSVGLRSCAILLLPSRAVQPNWASGKFKLMSGPVTSWPEQGAARDPRPTSDISQKEPCVGNVFLSVYIPCFIIIYHRRVHAGGLMVKASGWYA
jgi:hypothetical protein